MNESSQGIHRIFSRALFVTRTMPDPAIEGALQYSAHLLKLLAAVSVNVDVLCCANDMDGSLAAPAVGIPDHVRFHIGTKRRPTIGDKVLTRLPHPALPFATAENRALLRRLLSDRPEVVVVDHIGSTWALPEIGDWVARESSSVVWYATHNAERSTRLSFLAMDGGPLTHPARTAAVLLDAWRIKGIEKRLIRLADVTTAITEADSASYQHDCQAQCVVTVPPAYFGRRPSAIVSSDERPLRVCLLGTFVWSLKKANLKAFLRASSEIFRRHRIELEVIGWIEPDFRRQLEQQWPDVRFTGAVDEVHDYLRNGRIGVVAEQAGGGFKLKILDYVFADLPVFALRHSVAGTRLQDGEAAALFDDLQTLCLGIAERINDTDDLERLRCAARQACQDYLPERYDALPLHTALSRARAQKTTVGPGY